MCESLVRIQISFTLFQLLNLFSLCLFSPFAVSLSHTEYIMTILYIGKKRKPNDKTFTIAVSALNMNIVESFFRNVIFHKSTSADFVFVCTLYVFVLLMFAVCIYLPKYKKKIRSLKLV